MEENILQILHNKGPTLINENPNILATKGIHVKSIKILVKLGANLNAVDSNSRNCVMTATDHMSPTHFHELVNFLLTDYKAEYLFLPNEKWIDPLPTIIEAVGLLPETLELLLNIPGIDINMKDENGENLLVSAVRGLQLGNLKQLVSRGIDCNERGYENISLLHHAAKHGDGNMVRYLLSLNLDSNSRDDHEETPLHYAAENSHHSLSVVEVLAENGANVQAKDNWSQTALHVFASKEYGESCKTIKYLVGKGAGVNNSDNDGNTPLHSCSKKDVWDYLIEMGADIQATNKSGETAPQRNSHLWK